MSAAPVDREGFLAELETLVAQARAEGSVVVVALVDVRDLHRINGAFGLDAGDRVLEAVGERLAGVSRRSPVVRRTGEDEFATVFAGLASVELLPMIGSRILRALSEGLLVGEREIAFDVDVGLAAFPGDAAEAGELFFLAGQAVRTARERGVPFARHDPGALARLRERWSLEQELAEALATNALRLDYLPRIEFADGRPGSPEALLRWPAPTVPGITPDRIVPVLEQGGRALDLARWVLNTALRHARRWPQPGVSVNVSAAALGHPEFADIVTASLRIWGVAPGTLTIEIAESALPRAPEAIETQLGPLRAAGVRIAIDDFGAGHFALVHLKRLGAHEIKIDRSLVGGATQDERDRVLCAQLVSLAHAFGLGAVAVGVEDEATMRLMESIGCDAVQGFWIGRSLCEEDYRSWWQGNAAPAS